jgi:hypothetical protein
MMVDNKKVKNIFIFLFIVVIANANASELKIKSDQSSVAMGKSVVIHAHFKIDNPEKYILLPYVNQKRWGSHERADKKGDAVFSFPIPNPGIAQIEIIAVLSDTNSWAGLKNREVLYAGYPFKPKGIHSNVIEITVIRRQMPVINNSGTLFGMEWESWFIDDKNGWQSSQAVPSIGFYDSYNADVLRQQVLWMIDLGVNFIIPDWSNHIWGCKHWNERDPSTNKILHTTQLFLETLAKMRAEGIDVPKVAIMPGLSNGVPATMAALNEELDWIYQNYLRNPRFNDLWQIYDGKPLILILDTGAMANADAKSEQAFRISFFKMTLGLSAEKLDSLRANEKVKVDDSHFTVRWMSSQNQATEHNKLGYWTWMDGITEHPITYKDGAAEAGTVSTAFFDGDGWKAPTAHGRRGGATYIETFNWSYSHKPKFILLHQFNEFSGQSEDNGYGPNHNIYLDSYSVEFSDDIEPVSTTAAGYRGDKGGWGYYFLNLTRALISVDKNTSNSSTILSVAKPLRNSVIKKDQKLNVQWAVTGVKPNSYEILIDDKTVSNKFYGSAADISLNGLAKGNHKLTVKAENAITYFPLSYLKEDTILDRPIPVEVTVPFDIQ